VGQLASDEAFNLNNQRRAELLRARIEELNRRLASLARMRGEE